MPANSPSDNSERAKMWRQVAEYSGLALALPIATVLGFLAGRWLDAALGTSFLSVIGLVLGVAAGFLQLIRKALQDGSRQQ